LAIAAPEDAVDVRLWRAMAVCHRSGFPVELPLRMAGLEGEERRAACGRLIERRLADPLDEGNGWLRLSGASAAGAGKDLEGERRRHAEVVLEVAATWGSAADFRQRYEAEWMTAFRWAAGADWRLALGIGRQGVAFLRHQNRQVEATALLVALREAAEAHGEWQVSDECSWELSWLRGVPYKSAAWAPVDGDQLTLEF
jgi:hypothetical protein